VGTGRKYFTSSVRWAKVAECATGESGVPQNETGQASDREGIGSLQKHKKENVIEHFPRRAAWRKTIRCRDQGSAGLEKDVAG